MFIRMNEDLKRYGNLKELRIYIHIYHMTSVYICTTGSDNSICNAMNTLYTIIILQHLCSKKCTYNNLYTPHIT